MSINPNIQKNKGLIPNNNLYPVVVVKKIKLGKRNNDESWDNLPDIIEEEEATSHITIQEKSITDKFQHELSLIHTMDVEERNAHIRTCIQMSLENKITPKNAFALQLIDCMSLLLEEKKDFPMMACTLDAGAKIYSYRVDALHQQVVRLADEMALSDKKNKLNKPEGESEADESELLTIEKRRERKKNIIVSSASLQRKLKGKDPRSRFIKLEGVAGSITNRVRRNPKDLSYSLENNLPFWLDWDNYIPLRIGGCVKLPVNIKILRENKNTKTREPAMSVVLKSQLVNQDEPMVISLDGDPSPMEDLLTCRTSEHDNSDICGSGDHIDPDFTSQMTSTKEVAVVATVMKRLSQESGNKVSRLEALKILFNMTSEYHYLDMKNSHLWAGPEFWKRPRVQNKCSSKEKRANGRKRKEPGDIVYDLHVASVEEKWNSLFKSFKRRNILTTKTVQSWKKNKYTCPKDLKIGVNIFTQLFHMSNSEESETNQEIDNENKKFDQHEIKSEVNDHIQYLSSSSSSLDPSNDFYEGVPGQSKWIDSSATLNLTFNDVGIMPQEIKSGENELGRIVRVEVTPNGETSFDETTLVPAPKMVSFKPIKYSVRPVQVDMRHLKETMLDVIHEEILSKSTESVPSTSSACNVAPCEPETQLSRILKVLPERLDRRTGDNLSVAMAFMALLTITNENNLQLQDADNSDVTIKLENENQKSNTQ